MIVMHFLIPKLHPYRRTDSHAYVHTVNTDKPNRQVYEISITLQLANSI